MLERSLAPPAVVPVRDFPLSTQLLSKKCSHARTEFGTNFVGFDGNLQDFYAAGHSINFYAASLSVALKSAFGEHIGQCVD